MGNIRVDQLAETLGLELSGYRDEVAEAVRQTIKAAGEDCRKEIQRQSPKRTGKYRKGWRSQPVYDRPGGILVRVYNQTDGQLTHLLENGHAKKGGGRVEGKAHIRPAEQKVEQELLRNLREELEG